MRGDGAEGRAGGSMKAVVGTCYEGNEKPLLDFAEERERHALTFLKDDFDCLLKIDSRGERLKAEVC